MWKHGFIDQGQSFKCSVFGISFMYKCDYQLCTLSVTLISQYDAAYSFYDLLRLQCTFVDSVRKRAGDLELQWKNRHDPVSLSYEIFSTFPAGNQPPSLLVRAE